MRKTIGMLLALALLCAALGGLAEGQEPESAGEPFVGAWACGRCNIEIAPEGEGYRVHISWADSASVVVEWLYACSADTESGELRSDAGCKDVVTYGQDGEVAESQREYDDGEATFTLDETGMLHWNDAKENAGEDMAFERVVIAVDAPDAAALREGVVDVALLVHPGTAGSSLVAAQAAAELCDFAIAGEMWNVDPDGLRQNLLEACAALDEERSAAFNEGFDAIDACMDDALEDWEANRGLFEDADVAERLDAVMYDPLNRLAWQNLRDAVLSLGD